MLLTNCLPSSSLQQLDASYRLQNSSFQQQQHSPLNAVTDGVLSSQNNNVASDESMEMSETDGDNMSNRYLHVRVTIIL